MVLERKKLRRGFAAMDKDKQRAIAAKGGRQAHARGVAHAWTSEQARVAGRKGGKMNLGKKHIKKEGEQ